MSNQKSYYDKQIDSLNIDVNNGFKPTIQIWANGEKTNHMNISLKQLEQIRIILNEGSSCII